MTAAGKNRDTNNSGAKARMPASTALSSTGISTSRPTDALGREDSNLERHVGPERRAAHHGLVGTEVVEQADDLLAERGHRVEQRVVGPVGAAVPEKVDRDHVRTGGRELARQRLVHPARHQLAVHQDDPPLTRAVLGVLDAVTVVEVLADAFGDERHGGQFPTPPPRTTPCPAGPIWPQRTGEFGEDRPVAQPAGRTEVWRGALVALLVVLTLAAGLIGIEISQATDTTASWWPAAGVGVVALFVAPRSWWPRLVVALFVANLLANVLGGRSVEVSAALSVADCVETVLVCVGTRRLIGRHLDSLADLAWLVVVSLVGAVAAALGIALTSHVLLDGDFARTLLTTTGSHWASVIVIAPLGLLPARTVRRPSTFGVALHGLLLTAATLYVFGPGTNLTLSFAPLPFMIWAGVAFGSRVVVVEQVLMAAAVTWLTVGGHGPFATAEHPAGSVASNLITQLYLVCVVVTGLPLALSVRQQLQANNAVRNAQRRTEAVIDSSTTPIMVADSNGIMLLANPAVTRLTGFTTEDLVGRGFWERLLPTDRWAATRDAFADPEHIPQVGETVIRTATGGERVVTYANGVYHSPDDGSLHYVLTMSDITEERATQHLLEHLLRSATTVAIVGTDRTGRITVVNAGAEALLRFGAREATKHSFLDFLDHEELALRGVAAGVPAGFETLVHGVTEAESRTRDWTWVPPDGVPLVVSMTTSMIADGAEPTDRLPLRGSRRDRDPSQPGAAARGPAARAARRRPPARTGRRQGRLRQHREPRARTPLTSIIGSIELLEDGMAGELEPPRSR